MTEFKSVMAGSHISKVCEEAIKFTEKNGPCWFDFNGCRLEVQPRSTVGDICAAYDAHCAEQTRIYELPENVAKRKAEREERQHADDRAFSVFVGYLSSADEKGLREVECCWPRTEEQLLQVVQVLANRQHDYGTCCYAMSIAATATFYYISSKLGVTGFQASCADLDILRRTRSIDGPFMISKAKDALYPQYDPRKRLDEWLEESAPWLAEKASGMIKEGGAAHPDVVAHWRRLVVNGGVK